MSQPPDMDDLRPFLSERTWEPLFSDAVLKSGHKTARAKRVIHVHGTPLETGDIEITSQVVDAHGEIQTPEIIIWQESQKFHFETSCSCPVANCCEHAAALFEHLTRPGRLDKAFGRDQPGASQGKNAQNPLDSAPLPSPTENTQPAKARVRFHLDIRKRPDDPRVSWLPELYATAHAIYGQQSFSLQPNGNIDPSRSRAAEMEALNTLYALGLLPGAEQAPPSLRKLPKIKEILWAPNTSEWNPGIYWQRFRHEAIPALEKRGWTISIAERAGHQPLIFNASTWKTEIVEEGRGWFNLSAGFEIDGQHFDLQPILATLVEYDFLELTKNTPEKEHFLIFLPDGEHAGRGLSLPVGRFRRILTQLGELVHFQFTGKKIQLHKVEAAVVCEMLTQEDTSLQIPQAIEQLMPRSSGVPHEAVDVPSGLKATLRPYQLEGYQWMQFLAKNNLHGILADDMGLGKTMQSLTHILAEKEKGQPLPNLIIAPTSVVENWQREAAKFTPDLKVLILQGHNRHRRFKSLPHCDIAMTSYALLHRDLEHFSHQDFHLLILDEAQHIKNPDAQVSRAVRQIQSHHRICLSGTPIENHLGELWSQFDFLMPGLLGTAESFRETFRTPIEKNQNQARADALAQKVGPLILRRTKNQVAKELPPKTIIPHTIKLGTDEKDLYETVRSTMDKHVRKALAMRGQEAQMVFLDALLKLRQICCHPGLVDSSLTQKNETPSTSSKFQYLIDLLSTLKQEKRSVLLFSQFTSMLDLIEAHLIEQGSSYLKLTGASKNRHELVDIFQQGNTDVFLISLKAGGTGLTLTAADTVIHYDPWWNPAAENQATDRAYRIGQDKPVFVHKLICKGTVEERIQTMQDKKNTVADSILTSSLNQLKLDDDILASLLSPIDA
ncbi:DEAD/DEAH box helicase [Verrucomicrobiaceae bacterium N1E253]|uniref:DEAD/DEAH box helicase n=1 Tax=Oceaniferula marina TaxID=2748318 RepID=A0A851GMK2_9BACT|nr:DEAD/DEAH box helicase [Oceaniferula marina]NWK56365.1 DEAD/DEAH box helicase [Oceaniferula marina]